MRSGPSNLAQKLTKLTKIPTRSFLLFVGFGENKPSAQEETERTEETGSTDALSVTSVCSCANALPDRLPNPHPQSEIRN